YARQFEILCSDPGVLKLAAEVEAQLRRVPVLSNDAQFTVVTDHPRFHDCRLSSTLSFQTGDELLAQIFAAASLGWFDGAGSSRKKGRRIRLHLADVFIGFADKKLMRNRVADLSLRDYRLMLSVGWRQQTTLLKNAACAITRDGPVIHQRNSAPIGQHANGFGG